MQAEHCLIATASISSGGFDLIRSRLAPKCKMEIVTGLDVPTSPDVLKRIWRHYQERISLRVYTRNFFHPNVYIFDLPFRKAVAFVGSGQFTLEGLKDHEELFIKITDAKEIEGLKSWFTGYFEFSDPLSESLITEYELVYPSLRQKEFSARAEKKALIELTARGFAWEAIKFKNQYFKKEDYLTFQNSKAALVNPVVQTEREAVRTKLMHLNEELQRHAGLLKITSQQNHWLNSIDPQVHPDKKLKQLGLVYGRTVAGMKKYFPDATARDFMTLQLTIGQKYVSTSLSLGNEKEGRIDRENLQQQMNDSAYRSLFYKTLTSLGKSYRIEIFGESKEAGGFANEDALWEFIKLDEWAYYSFKIEKQFSPGDSAIGNDAIVSTIENEFNLLITLYNLIKGTD